MVDDVGLYGTDISLRWIEDKLQQSLQTSARFGPNVTTAKIGIGRGFMSVMLRLVADWIADDDQAKQLPPSFVVKIPTTKTTTDITSGEAFREQMKEVDDTVDPDDYFKGFEAVLSMVR
jgi:hypothetical protein